VEYEAVDQAREALLALKDYKFRSSDRHLVIDYDRDTKVTRKRKEFPERDRGDKDNKFTRDSRERESVRDSVRNRERDYERERFSREREREIRDSRDRYPRPDHHDDFRRGDPHPHSFSNDSASLLFPRTNLFGQLPFPGFGGLYGNQSSHHSKENPCPTLFVGNLPSDVTERELSILFRFMPGFYGVRLITRDGKFPICFVDFSDTACASVAMQYFQGFKMDKDSLGLSIEYDKGTKSEKERDRHLSDRDRGKDRDRDRERENLRERERETRRGRSK